MIPIMVAWIVLMISVTIKTPLPVFCEYILEEKLDMAMTKQINMPVTSLCLTGAFLLISLLHAVSRPPSAVRIRETSVGLLSNRRV